MSNMHWRRHELIFADVEGHMSEMCKIDYEHQKNESSKFSRNDSCRSSHKCAMVG